MLRAVGEPRRIERAIKRLQATLKGVPSRGVRLTWRGGELRTTIHWARDDGFWWAFEPKPARHALLLGHAPDAPAKRESITCEINLPREGADRKIAGIVAVDEHDALYLAHSGRMGGARPGQSRDGTRKSRAPSGVLRVRSGVSTSRNPSASIASRMIALIRASQVHHGTAVWRQGFPGWIKVEHSELAQHLDAHSPPPLSGDMVNNRMVWLLAFAPLLGYLLECVLAGIIHGGNEAAAELAMAQRYFLY